MSESQTIYGFSETGVLLLEPRQFPLTPIEVQAWYVSENRDLLPVRQHIIFDTNLFRHERDMNGARQARDAEIKVQRRSNRCSSDDVWGIWFAAKSGGTDRLEILPGF